MFSSAFLATQAVYSKSKPNKHRQKVPGEKKLEVQFVRPEAYAIRRFGEIVKSYLKEIPNSAQDRLLRQRALLALTETKLQSIESKLSSDDPSNSNSTDNTFKSLEAKTDYHKKRIEFLERQILKKRKR